MHVARRSWRRAVCYFTRDDALSSARNGCCCRLHFVPAWLRVAAVVVPARIFLLSPARSSGPRAEQLARSSTELGLALRSDQGAALGDVFAFLSSLYFRGKLAYAMKFGATDLALPGALVITPGHGLCRPSTRIRAADLARIGQVDVAVSNPGFVQPLLRDASMLARSLPAHAQVVLLGSIATPKYVEPLLSVLGERLLFPSEFVGRGDMSRGGLMLRAAREDTELLCVPVQAALLRGRRAKKLDRLA